MLGSERVELGLIEVTSDLSSRRMKVISDLKFISSGVAVAWSAGSQVYRVSCFSGTRKKKACFWVWGAGVFVLILVLWGWRGEAVSMLWRG